MKLQPFYIASLLVEQPTWGGEYIAQFKNISLPKIKIGQSYELAKDSILLTTQPTAELPFLLASANDIAHPQWQGEPVEHINIQELIDLDPNGVLGVKVVKKTGPQMTLLNKFTQAQENSYQIHVAPGNEFNHWQPKLESWYYFEPGKATLGLRSGVDVKQYHQRCQAIYQRSNQLSQEVKNEKITVEVAREQLAEFINQDHPSNYINTIYPQRDSIVDLSCGGLHHSWESDPSLPNGNIVYEVQLDQRDEVSSIRAFDQGKIKDNGDIRNIAIDDYFAALNKDDAYNEPQQYMQTPQVERKGGVEITHIFTNPSYHLTQIEFAGKYEGKETQLNQKFQHLFVKKGQAIITWNDQEWPLAAGQSLFIPANCENYRLNATQQTAILKTTA